MIPNHSPSSANKEVLVGLIISLITVVLYVVALLQIVKSAASTGKKVLWAIVVLLFPIIGAVIYLVIGSKK
ncbi:MAG: PLDc_N domain-containing protein [Candidatus Omnitrophica bacterium]|jgi:hypothetical protein|nr:PLDc_N domain-containing protein [Candidatus Omnitrophota bacterium]